MTQNRPTILIGNDDGFRAPGVQELAKELTKIGDVVMVGPSGPRSGFSSSITTTQALKLKPRKSDVEGLTIYSTDGTPVDCIKLALHTLFKDRKPDLLIAGCNHGSNEGICVFYSGTVGVAMEGAIVGVPSLAVSLDDVAIHPDFSEAIKYAMIVVQNMLTHKLPPFTALSLNVPKGKVKGLKVCEQSIGRFIDEYVQSKDGRDNDVYWCKGYQIALVEDKGDYHYMREGYATLTPLQLNLTNKDFLKPLEDWFK